MSNFFVDRAEALFGCAYPADAKELLEVLQNRMFRIHVNFQISYVPLRIMDLGVSYPLLEAEKDLKKYIPEYHPSFSHIVAGGVIPFAMQSNADKSYCLFYSGYDQAYYMFNVNGVFDAPVRRGTAMADFLGDQALLLAQIAEADSDIDVKGQLLRVAFPGMGIFSQFPIAIAGVEDYKMLLEDILAISHGALSLQTFSGRQQGDKYLLDITVNDIQGQLSLDVGGVDYAIIRELNKTVLQINRKRKFVFLTDRETEVGVGYFDSDQVFTATESGIGPFDVKRDLPL